MPRQNKANYFYHSGSLRNSLLSKKFSKYSADAMIVCFDFEVNCNTKGLIAALKGLIDKGHELL